MKAIIAVNNLGFIGMNNKLLWRSSDDLKHFKALTLDAELLVGFNTHQELPEAFTKRVKNLIIDERGPVWGGMYRKMYFLQSPMICIGGKKTYEKYASVFTELHISHINDNQIGDCTFPDLSNLNPDCKIFNYYFEVNGPK